MPWRRGWGNGLNRNWDSLKSAFYLKSKFSWKLKALWTAIHSDKSVLKVLLILQLNNPNIPADCLSLTSHPGKPD